MHYKSRELNPLVLSIFAMADVMLYGVEIPIIQFIIAILSYVYIIVIYKSNQRLGILYFISFNILSIGIGNYWNAESSIISYWGLRAGPFSFNILFSFILAAGGCIKNRFHHIIPNDPYTKFFIVFFMCGFVVGIIMVVTGNVYLDNFLTDFMIFFPIMIYIVLCKDITLPELEQIIRYMIPITVYCVFAAYLFNKKASYSAEEFVIGDAFATTVAPVGIVILRKYFNLRQQIIFLLIYGLLIATFSLLLAGKTIISFILLLLWWASLNKKWRFFNWCCIIASIPLAAFLLEYFIEFTSNNSGITTFKISQVLSLVDNPDFLAIASEYSSVGNIIAEGYTLFHYMLNHIIFLIFGKGFGGGIQDLFGFLTPFAGKAGYAVIDATRNNFFNLHIAPYKIFIDGGIIIFCYYLKILYSILSHKSALSFISFLMMLFYFYVSKEFMLLTYVFLRILYLKSNN